MQGYSIVAKAFAQRCPVGAWSSEGWQSALAVVSAVAIAGLTGPSPAQAQGYDVVPPLPAGVIPVPGVAATQVPATGQQYVVYVSDTSEATLQRVQMVEPTAFRTTFQGQSVIQAGRFNQPGNAQQRVNDLAAQGVMAQMAQAPAVQPVYAQPSNLPANVYASGGDLPPLPGVTVLPPPATTSLPALPPPTQIPPSPNSVTFGQPSGYPAPASAPASAVTMAPPTGGTVAAPVASPAVPNAPYYVVIPTSSANLAALSAQVIQLGTPADRVQQRLEPRGPHVAVGPFADQGLANRWSNFYTEAGIPNSRVFYQR